MTVTEDQQVSLSVYEYLELLCEADVTDPERWPAGTEQGAALLARIREIEAECRARHGKWDWELLSEELQDEYDIASSKLDLLVESFNPDQRVYSHQEVFGDFDKGEVA
jgi:hypothetical protein